MCKTQSGKQGTAEGNGDLLDHERFVGVAILSFCQFGAVHCCYPPSVWLFAKRTGGKCAIVGQRRRETGPMPGAAGLAALAVHAGRESIDQLS